MGSQMYVGNLPFTVSERQLATRVAEGGRLVVDITMVMDRDTGRPRGFAFAEMGSQVAAHAVIASLSERIIEDRTLTVSMARERLPREGGTGGGGINRGRIGGHRRNAY